MRQGSDRQGLAGQAALSRQRRPVKRPVARTFRAVVVLAAMVACVGAQPASGQADDDSVRMIPLAPQVEVPPEIGAVDVEVVALGADAGAVEVEAGGKSSVLIASDAEGTLMLAAANEDGGYVGEGPGAVQLGIESTAITLVAVAAGRRFGEIDPELAQAIRSHQEFGRLTRLLESLMASDKNYLDRLYSYPQAVTLIKGVAAGVASVGAEPAAEAGPGFKQLQGRDVAQALAAAEDIAAYNSETGPIAPFYKEDFYCIPGSGYSFGLIPCSPWNDREPWHWYGEAEGVRAFFPDNFLEVVLFIVSAPIGLAKEYAELVWQASGALPFPAVSEDTVRGCRSWDWTCTEDGVHATANPNFVNYAMELYDDGVYRDWFYTPGNSTMTDKLLNSGAAYREFRAGPRRTKSVLLSPDIDVVRFQRYRFSLAGGDEKGVDRGAVVSFMNTLHLVIAAINVITDVSEVGSVLRNADVVNLAEPIVECSAEVVNSVSRTFPDVIVDGQVVLNSDPDKEVQDLLLGSLVNLGSAYLGALQSPACRNLLTQAVKGGVSKSVVDNAGSVVGKLFGSGSKQLLKSAADAALFWVKLGFDVANEAIPVGLAYFRPAGDGVDYQLFWDENPNGTPYISLVAKRSPPTAQFTYTQRGGFEVELDGSQTVPGDSDDLAFTWHVNGARIGEGERLVHDFGSEGRYRVMLVVIDGNGLSGTFSSRVDVIPGSEPEVASLDCTPTSYRTFRMVASFSDPDGDIETVEWRGNVGSLEPDRVTSSGTTQVEMRASGAPTWASVTVEDAMGNRGSRVCNVSFEYLPTARIEIDSLSAACGREEPWKACYHRVGVNQGDLVEFAVSMPRESTGTWHVAWCAKEESEGLCRGQHDWTTQINKRFANEAPLKFPMTLPEDVETFWVVAEVRECVEALCTWPEDFTEVEFHHIEVTILSTDRQVLEAFYDATGGPRWRNNRNWKTSEPLSSWYGVVTDANGRVTGLWLPNNNLSGTIPVDLGYLTRLEEIDLSRNALYGELPASLTELRRLRRFRFRDNAGLCAPSSPAFKDWLGGIADSPGPSCGSPDTDRQVLEAFYDATGGPRWENSTNWKTAVPLEQWHGVVTDEDGRVVGLELGGNGLKGSLPAELRNLSRLERLNLSHNNLSGRIPAELGRLTHLEVLGLWGNDLSGTIPVELGKLTNLVTLELPANDLSGRIPSALGNLTRLKDLRLWGNSLSAPIPAELGDLTNLQSLELADNSLSGWIPAELGDLTLLERLDLSSNNLSGRIPSALARLTHLVTLELGGNRLIGEIPMRLSRLPRLEHLSLSRNSLRGPIPAALGNLPRLETLVLFANKLTGPIPSELGRLTRLETLSLSFNQLSGELPSSLTNLRQLSFFRFLDNAGLCAPSTPAFEQWREGISDFLGLTCGSRPPPLSDRDALVAVFWATDGLSWSNVTNWLSDKPLDEWYGVFTDAEGRVIELKLDDNNLTGRIPASLANLSRLRVLNLNENNLIGKLPADLGHLTNLQRLYLSSNNLSGEIPWLLTNLRELQVFWFQENNGLCEPVSPVFAQWSGVVSDIRGPVCLLDSTAETDRKALEAAYDAAGGPGWTRSTNWKTAEPLNEWHGVKTNEDGRVIELKLNNNALLGTMPASLGDLTHLRQLDLSRNGLRGMVEAKLGNLAHLERLWLSNNSMFGQLPWSLTKLWRLSVFHFQGNSELCAPSSPAFRNWFDGIADFRGLTCGTDGIPNHPPQPKGRIGNVTLQVGGGAKRVEELGQYFQDPDGDQLTYLPSTTPAGRVTARRVSPNTVEISPVSVGRGTVTITARDPGGLRAEQRISVTVNPAPPTNHPPVVRGRIDNQNLKVGDPPVTIESVGRFFYDPDGDTLTFSAGSSDTSKATATVINRDTLKISPVAAGTATVTLTARDPDRLTAQQRINVRVNPRSGNRPPEPRGRIDNQNLKVGDPPVTIESVGRFFYDPDGDTLTFSAGSSDTSKATARVINRDTLKISPVAAGTATVTLTARDPGNLRAEQSFTVRVLPKPPDPDPPDRQILKEFYDATNGPGWDNRTNWNTSAPLNEWYGVRTDPSGRVFELDLTDNDLSGTIPASLGNLTHLNWLFLAVNNLTGTIPASLGNLTNLRWLSLSWNNLSGRIPAELGRLSNLEKLGLNNNLDPNVGLSGTIPASLGNLARLKVLHLSLNRLSGAVPAELGRLSNLETLYLNSNNLTGMLPSALTNLRKLTKFRFNRNDGLCAPSTTAFQEWLRGVDDTNGPTCSSTDPDPETTRVFDGITFVWVPAGEFQMGSTSSEAGRDERPVTQVRISRGFWMGKYEVTQAQWEAVIGSNPSGFKNCGLDCPVEQVSWQDVQEFIRKLNERGSGNRYRLPTEAEWEYAARAGTTGDRYGSLDAIAWWSDNSDSRTHQVGQKAPNAWGLRDMLGNVWEWVQDGYDDYPGGTVTDPVGSGSGLPRNFRGGGWGSHSGRCRSTYRFSVEATLFDIDVGFRLARTN